MNRKLLIIPILAFVLTSCSLFNPTETAASDSTTPIETIAPSTTFTPTTVAPVPDSNPPAEGVNSDFFDGNLGAVDKFNPDEVALMVGCAFYAKPTRADTNADLAERLRPLITEELHAAIPTIRTAGDEIATVIPALADEVRFEFYEVSCNRSVIDLDGTRRLEGAFIDVRVEEQPDESFLVSEMTIGALTLPTPAS